MWDEFHDRLPVLAPESEEMLHDLFTKDEDKEVDFLQRDRVKLEPSRFVPPSGPTERKRQFVFAGASNSLDKPF